MAGMFGNKYDTRSEVNQGISDFGFKMGQMSQQKYAGMAAAEGMMGYMSGLGSPDNDPRMKKQGVLDELMLAHPDPKTPEELEALAMDLSARGFNDEAFKVREIITEMKAAAAANTLATTKATQPTADMYKNLGSALSSQVLSTGFLNKYLTIHAPELAGKFDKKIHGTYSQYKAERKAYEDDLAGLFTQWSNSKKYDGSTKNELATLRGDDAGMTEDFLTWLDAHGNSEMATYMRGAMTSVEGAQTDTGVIIVDDNVIAEGDPTLEAIKIKVQNIPSAQLESRIIMLKNFGASMSKEQKIELQLLEKKLNDQSFKKTTNATGGEIAINDAMSGANNSDMLDVFA